MLCTDDKTSSCASISGATQDKYVLTSDDYKKYLRIKITASNGGGATSQISRATKPIPGPACVRAAAISSTRTKIGSSVISVSSLPAAYYGNKKQVRFVAKSNRSKADFVWYLDNKRLASKNKTTASTLNLSNSRLLIGKHQLILSVKIGKNTRRIIKNITTSPCPDARRLTPKPSTRSFSLSGHKFKVYVSSIYSVLQPGAWRISGARPSSVLWQLDKKTVSRSKTRVYVAPNKLTLGKHVISVRIKSGSRSKTLNWSVASVDYPNK
jgi:hypothetical protein